MLKLFDILDMSLIQERLMALFLIIFCAIFDLVFLCLKFYSNDERKWLIQIFAMSLWSIQTFQIIPSVQVLYTIEKNKINIIIIYLFNIDNTRLRKKRLLILTSISINSVTSTNMNNTFFYHDQDYHNHHDHYSEKSNM